MIDQIILFDFQPHQKLRLELDEHITMLQAPTDFGKSSAIRALRWLAVNRPGGDSFIRKGAERVKVVARFEDHKVVRSKGSGGNIYALDGKKYVSFGHGVPEDVEKLLNLSELNIQRQHSAHFWLALSPGEVSKELNAIVNLGLIDRTLVGVAAKLKKAKVRVELGSERLQEARKTRDELSWVKEASDGLDKIEKLGEQASEKRLKSARIASLLGEARDSLAARERGRGASRAFAGPSKAVSRAGESRKRLEGLETLLKDIKEARKRGNQWKKDMVAAEKQLAAIKTCPLCGKPTQS